jgi:branched-subunit amino acid aminotransferase/4-amino-4-deoxychorismate lyase
VGGSRLWTDGDPLPSTTIIQVGPVEPQLAQLREAGTRAITSSHRVNEGSIVAGVKTIGYAGHILAKRQAIDAGAWEAIILNCKGDVVEGSMSNIFVVWDDEVYTPPLESGPLAGVTRQTVLDLARSEGIVCNEVRFGLDALRVADECFLTSSVAEIVPVTVLDGRPVGDGGVGEITCRLQGAYTLLATRLP